MGFRHYIDTLKIIIKIDLNGGLHNFNNWFGELIIYCEPAGSHHWYKSIPLQNRFIFIIKSINIMSVETSSTTK